MSYFDIISFSIISAISIMGVLLICFLNFSSKRFQNKPFNKRTLYIEEYTVYLIVALWIFYLCELKIALPLWLVMYLFINILFIKNAIIKSAYNEDNHYVIKQFKKGILIHKNLWQTKKFIAGGYLKKCNLKPVNFYLKQRTSFGIGLLVASIFIFLDNYILATTFDVLLNNITLLTAIVLNLHKILSIATIENVNSTWFDRKIAFNIFYILHCVVLYIVVIVISLG